MSEPYMPDFVMIVAIYPYFLSPQQPIGPTKLAQMVGYWTHNQRVVGPNPPSYLDLVQLVSKSSKCKDRPSMWHTGSCAYMEHVDI